MTWERQSQVRSESASSARTHDSGTEQRRESFVVSAPSISLPKGGGAIRGIGEKFAANPVTGTGSMSVPVSTTQGRSGVEAFQR